MSISKLESRRKLKEKTRNQKGCRSSMNNRSSIWNNLKKWKNLNFTISNFQPPSTPISWEMLTSFPLSSQSNPLLRLKLNHQLCMSPNTKDWRNTNKIIIKLLMRETSLNYLLLWLQINLNLLKLLNPLLFQSLSLFNPKNQLKPMLGNSNSSHKWKSEVKRK
jgi:hypothetical protein